MKTMKRTQQSISTLCQHFFMSLVRFSYLMSMSSGVRLRHLLYLEDVFALWFRKKTCPKEKKIIQFLLDPSSYFRTVRISSMRISCFPSTIVWWTQFGTYTNTKIMIKNDKILSNIAKNL